MKCKICDEELEYFGSCFMIKDGKKIKKVFGLCTRHLPYEPATLMRIENVK